MASFHSPSNVRVNRFKVVRLMLVLVGLFFLCYVLSPLLLWHSRRHSTDLAASSCSPCSCDCFSEPSFDLHLDCDKDDPKTNNELKKDIVALLNEEIDLQKNVTYDSLEQAKALIIGAKRTSSHYQKEAEKCNAGIETCEEARERAEAALIEERKLTAFWISRAHEYGWDEDRNDFLQT